MFGRGQDIPDGRIPFFDIEAERPLGAVEGQLAVLVDHEQPDRLGDILILNLIANGIEQHRQLDVEPDLAGIGDRGPFILGLRLQVHHIVIKVLRRLPAIRWMGFMDVDQEELDIVLVGIVNFVQTHGPITKGGSCVGAETERDRFSH